MVRAPAHFDARERPDTKASPGLPRRAGLLFAFDLARDEVGLRRQRRSTISLFSRHADRGDRKTCAASARASLSHKISDSTFKQRRKTSIGGPAPRCAR